MKVFSVIWTSLLLVLWLRVDRCQCLNDSSLPTIFYPFGRDEGDLTVPFGDDNCHGPITLSLSVFNQPTLFVS